MQLKVLFKKDVTALFRQRAVIFTLVFPMVVIIFIGIIPLFFSNAEPFEIGYLIEDEGIVQNNSSLNLGDLILNQLIIEIDSDDTLILVELKDYQEFILFEDALWIPKNFTIVANHTRNAHYFITKSDSNLRSNPVMTVTVKTIVDNIVTTELIPIELPIIVQEELYLENELLSSGEAKNRGEIAFPLAYIAFLILIMGSSSMRLTGFSAEKEADMMELLLSSVIHRRELILSKLLTGILYGFVSVMSYLIGLTVVLIIGINLSEGETLLEIPTELITIENILVIIFLFVVLSFVSMEVLLATQLTMGREGGERFGSTILMIMTIMFYATTIIDPLAESPIQIINPFFWPFKIALNVIFKEGLIASLLYLLALVIFCTILLIIQTRAIEKEKVLFE